MDANANQSALVRYCRFFPGGAPSVYFIFASPPPHCGCSSDCSHHAEGGRSRFVPRKWFPRDLGNQKHALGCEVVGPHDPESLRSLNTALRGLTQASPLLVGEKWTICRSVMKTPIALYPVTDISIATHIEIHVKIRLLRVFPSRCFTYL